MKHKLAAGVICVVGPALLAAVALSAVTRNAAYGTPQLTPGHGVQQIRQLVHCGKLIYAVGDFSSISSHGHTYKRHNLFSFHATRPFGVTSWNPNANGEVNSIAVGDHCRAAFVGGSFSQVHGSPAARLARISTTTGAVDKHFARAANNTVETVRDHNGHILVGGYFTAINNSRRNYYASLSPTTGKPDDFAALNISGNYHYCDFRGCASDPPRIYNQQVSHNGRYDLLEGVFTHIGGKHRQQIAMLNLTGKRATVTDWTSGEFFHRCASVESFYVRAAAWSPDDHDIYTASTGYRYDKPNGSRGGPPMEYLCDTAAAFPATHKSVSPLWIDYTGCDSLYSAAADSTTAYFGGHERWSHNRYACDSAGRGHINAPGLEGLNRKTGRLVLNPTRARGIGADDMIIDRQGLWIASDDESGGMCAGKLNHGGLCLLKR